MKQFFCITMSLIILFLGSAKGLCAEKLHPRNKKLIELKQIPPMKYFPEVPRIMAAEAYGLYAKGQAIFIAIGHDAPRIVGGWLLEDYMRFNPKRLRIPEGVFIITY